MVASNFAASLALVRKSEGGNDDDPQDHGGRTSRGITQREYDAWRKERHLPTRDVWTATDDEIDTIYHDEYWMPNCDLLPIGTDYMVFNGNVLQGPVTMARLLQRALGVATDGRIGPITRNAIKAADPKELIIKLSHVSADFYQSLHQPRFTRGWLNRVEFVRKNALAMLEKGTTNAS